MGIKHFFYWFKSQFSKDMHKMRKRQTLEDINVGIDNLMIDNDIDMTEYYPVYWFINGRAGPDDLADSFVAWLPHQPYNATPRMRPGEKLHEALVEPDEIVESSPNPLIRKAKPVRVSFDTESALAMLLAPAEAGDREGVRTALEKVLSGVNLFSSRSDTP